MLARQEGYRLLLSAGLISLTGDWILRAGLAFHGYTVTDSTLASGGLLLASFVPMVVLGSFAGVFVDRWDQRPAMIVINLLHAIAVLPLLVVRDEQTIWIVYVVVLAQSCLQRFFTPAEQSLVPMLVEPRQSLTANALNSQTRDIARLVGAALRVHHRTECAPAEQTAGAIQRLIAEWTVTGIGEGMMSTLFVPFASAELGGDARAHGLILSPQAVGGIAGGLVAAVVVCGTRRHHPGPRPFISWYDEANRQSARDRMSPRSRCRWPTRPGECRADPRVGLMEPPGPRQSVVTARRTHSRSRVRRCSCAAEGSWSVAA